MSHRVALSQGVFHHRGWLCLGKITMLCTEMRCTLDESQHLYQHLAYRHFPVKDMGITKWSLSQRGATIRWDSGMLKPVPIPAFAWHRQGGRRRPDQCLVESWPRISWEIDQKITMATATLSTSMSPGPRESYRWITLPSIGSPVNGCHLVPMKVIFLGWTLWRFYLIASRYPSLLQKTSWVWRMGVWQ